MHAISLRSRQSDNVSVRQHGKCSIGAKPKGGIIADILVAIKERRV